jgi:8'-apo-carotenoid 13,14-cleaving dioxygenase
MVFGVRLRDGKAEWYRNRFVRDDRISATLHLPRVPGPDQLSRAEPYRERKGPRYVEANVTNTHVFAVNGRTYAFAEAGVLPMELSYELETVARTDFGGTLNGAWTGHPHRDPVTGELHGIAYFWQWDHATYQVLGTDGTITKRIDVPLTGPSTIHDMAFTEKYAVFLDGPVIFNEAAHVAGYEFPYMWDQDYPVRWAVVDRTGTEADVRFCASGQSAVFHILNAFDLPDSRIAVDGVSYPKLFVDDLTGPTDSKGRLDRFILDPATGTTMIERLDDRPQEMPRMDERICGRRHRYGYFSSRLGNSGILKQDLHAGKQEFCDHGPGRVGIETRKANDVFARQLLKLWHDNGNHNPDALYDTDRTLANGNSLVGAAETVRDKLAEQVRQAPVNYFEATLAFGDLTPDEATANLTAFAETVMPAVRAAFQARASYLPDKPHGAGAGA